MSITLQISDYGQICRRHGYTELNESDLDISVTNSYEDEDMASNSGLNGLYRPRSALARALYEKQQNDRHLQEFDQNEWYRVDKSRLSPELQEKFVQLEPDHETKEFLSSSIDKSSWVWTQIWYLLAKAVLKHFWTITDINGYHHPFSSRGVEREKKGQQWPLKYTTTTTYRPLRSPIRLPSEWAKPLVVLFQQ
ncbi:jg16694 [Pararge aegeria aegeria]|uniref:Jg16694 protein n=1 Tax=Pararge aegeria aegeria TaxID=348720 RepID=A0A8S4RJ46_9NEOP|nr:jg16694 [Pararge aegeria aegeria]